MKKTKKNDIDETRIKHSTIDFVEYYNENIPSKSKLFPPATMEALRRFRATHPALFANSRKWTVDRHRKKVMDWLISYNNEAS
jgi:hypothetical protein